MASELWFTATWICCFWACGRTELHGGSRDACPIVGAEMLALWWPGRRERVKGRAWDKAFPPKAHPSVACFLHFGLTITPPIKLWICQWTNPFLRLTGEEAGNPVTSEALPLRAATLGPSLQQMSFWVTLHGQPIMCLFCSQNTSYFQKYFYYL